MAVSKDFVMDLARLTVAAAWADGELANDEVNSLKELLWGLEHVTEDDWKILELYMDHPVAKEEADELLQRVVEGIRSNEHKALVINCLTALFEADGQVTPEEQAFLEEIQRAVAGVETGVFSLFSKAMKSAVGQRRARLSSGRREASLGDFTENTIYYRFKRKQGESKIEASLPDERLRKLCLATGLMARVAHCDGNISAGEQAGMRAVIEDEWQLSPEVAGILVELTCAEAAKDLDFPRVAYNYFSCTDHAERQRFLVTLFRIANACGGTSHDEIEEIRQIAQLLKLAHGDFIDAKLSVPREERGGL